jgi:hypothetical protein
MKLKLFYSITVTLIVLLSGALYLSSCQKEASLEPSTQNASTAEASLREEDPDPDPEACCGASFVNFSALPNGNILANFKYKKYYSNVANTRRYTITVTRSLTGATWTSATFIPNSLPNCEFINLPVNLSAIVTQNFYGCKDRYRVTLRVQYLSPTNTWITCGTATSPNYYLGDALCE